MSEENKALYGYCPICGSPGIARKGEIHNKDTCTLGHTYPTSQSIQITVPVGLPRQSFVVKPSGSAVEEWLSKIDKALAKSDAIVVEAEVLRKQAKYLQMDIANKAHRIKVLEHLNGGTVITLSEQTTEIRRLMRCLFDVAHDAHSMGMMDAGSSTIIVNESENKRVDEMVKSQTNISREDLDFV